MKSRHICMYVFTSCVVLAAAPSQAQYGQSGRGSDFPSTTRYPSTDVTNPYQLPSMSYEVASSPYAPPQSPYANASSPYVPAANPYGPSPSPYAPPYGNSYEQPALSTTQPGDAVAPNASPFGGTTPQHQTPLNAPDQTVTPNVDPQWSDSPQPPGRPYQESVLAPGPETGPGHGGHSHAGPSHVAPSPSGDHVPFMGQAARGKTKQPWNRSATCSTCGGFACGGASGGVCGPNNGMYFQYDRVYWSISAPETTDIGHAPSERIVTTPDGITLFYQNDLDTSFLDSDFSTGDRFDFGYLNCNWGWAASVLYVKQGQSLHATGVSYVPFDPDGLMSGYQDANGDTFDDDIDMDNLFGRNGEDLGTPDGGGGFVAPFDGIPDTPAPADTGDLVTYLVTFGAMSVQNSTEMTGVELMNIYRTGGSHSGNTLDWYYGMRYLQVRDRFLISGTGGFLDAMVLDTDVDNDIVGPQVGGRWARRMGSFVMSVEGRFMLGYNFQRSEQSGHVATIASPGGQNGPVSLTAHTANHARTDEQFAPLGELRLDMAYKMNRWSAFRFGYTAMVASGIGRASEQVLYGLPNFGLNTADNDQTLFSNALTFGLELNR